MKMNERDYWIAFSAFPQIGPKRFNLLKDYFGSARKAWEAPAKAFLEIGLKDDLVQKFVDFRKTFNLSSYFLRLKKAGFEWLCYEDKNYPENLKNIDGPPFVIYTLGELKSADCLSLAVVGARKMTGYGRQVTEVLVSDLTASGLTIVSGLAYGVDSVAHNTAIDSGGRTIGVWAGGLDTIFSGYRKVLVDKILKTGQGAVISEFPLGFNPQPSTFPQRNRVISGLSLGVLVVEAAEKSGSLITASHAANQGREVFAVPGPITSGLSKGTADLIKKGAKLVYNVKDILEELDIKSKIETQKAKEILPENQEEKIILDFLRNEKKQIDEIIKETGMEAGKVA